MATTLLKFIVATLLLSWLIHSGKLDFNLLWRSLQSPLLWLSALALILANLMTSTYRWRWILQTETGKKLPFLKALRFSWIGVFFNSVLPGSVSGDLIKMVYVFREEKDFSKTFLLVSLFLDRFMGILALSFILGLSTLVSMSSSITGNATLQGLYGFNLCCFLAGLVGVGSFYLPTRIKEYLLALTAKVPKLGGRIHQILSFIWEASAHQGLIWGALFTSLLGQVLVLFAFWLLAYPYIAGDMHFIQFFSIAPLGLFSVAIPISPGGLGVGHAVFDKLFSFYGVEGGASYFNLFFFAQMFINLLGVLPYLKGSSSITQEELKRLGKATS